MVKTRHSGGNGDSDDNEDQIIALMPHNYHDRVSKTRPNYAESDESGSVAELKPQRKKYNMRHKSSSSFRNSHLANDSESNNDDEVIITENRHRRFSGHDRKSSRPSHALANGDLDDMESQPRRSTRQRSLVYGTFNLRAIGKYPVAYHRFENDILARSVKRKKNDAASVGEKYDRNIKVMNGGTDAENDEECIDMYSRVKRDRRNIKRDMYGIPINQGDEEEESGQDDERLSGNEEQLARKMKRQIMPKPKRRVAENQEEEGDTTEVEGSDNENKKPAVNEKVDDGSETECESESESDSEEQGPKQYFLREHRPRTQIFDAAPAASTSRRPPKLMNIIPHSPARRRNYLSTEHKSPAHKTHSFRSKRRTAFHGSSSTSSSSSISSSDEGRFERRKHKSMQRSRNRCLPMNMQPEDETGVLRDRSRIGSSLADVDPMTIDKSVTFESVGGLGSNIRALKEMIIFPLMYPEVFDKFHIQPPRGVLFYGPPGTGKTLVARALANECSKGERRVAFFMRKGADCLSKWVGESERQLRLLFDQAYQMRPSILFFDEIDGLAPVRSSRQDQIHSSIVSTLLALMDGLDSRGEVVIIGATNRIDSIDPALRRPGRFDREFLFPLPSFPARKHILKIHTSKWNPSLPDSFVDELAERCVGYCGADLRSLCTEAALFALRRRYPQIYTTSDKLQLDVNSIRIGAQDFQRAIETIVPASQRSVTSPGRALGSLILPLLRSQFDNAVMQLRKIFPVAANHSHDSATPQDDEVVLSDYEEEDTLLNTHHHNKQVNRSQPGQSFLASFSTSHQSTAYRPRLLLSGCAGQGQSSYLAPAILHVLERLPAHVLDLPALYGISARSPEESCSQVFREARRTSPSIIYMPYIDQWWEAINETLSATFLTLLQDLAPSAPILLLATSDRPLQLLPPILQSVFTSGSRIEMVNPNADERREFFRDLFTNQVYKPPSRKRQEVTQLLEVLPVAPPPEPRRLTEKEQQRLFELEDATLRELRLFLRDVINKLGQDRKFNIFTKPVDIEEVEDYYDVIATPMDLSTMMSKIDLHQYLTAASFLADIDLICSNALEYNPDKNPQDRAIRHRACALRDLAQSIVENELDPDFEKRCEEIDIARRSRGESPSKTAPSFYKVPPKKPPSAHDTALRPAPAATHTVTRTAADDRNWSVNSDSDISRTTKTFTSTGKPKFHHRITPHDKVKVISNSEFREMQRRRHKLSPWCRPKRRRVCRLVVVADSPEEDTNENEAESENDDDDDQDEKLAPIAERTEDDNSEASSSVPQTESAKSKLSPSTKPSNDDDVASLEGVKSSPDDASIRQSKMHTSAKLCALKCSEICHDKHFESHGSMNTGDLQLDVCVSLCKVDDLPPSRSSRGHSPSRSSRGHSPRNLFTAFPIMQAQDIKHEIIEVPDSADQVNDEGANSVRMPRLSAPSPILVNNEDSNKENDMPVVAPKLQSETQSMKRKRSVDDEVSSASGADDMSDGHGNDDEDDDGTEIDEERAAAINISPRVTRFRASCSAPPPPAAPPPSLLVDRPAMTSLWQTTVEKTCDFDLERLENLHCLLRDCVQAHRRDYNKTSLLNDLCATVANFTSNRQSTS